MDIPARDVPVGRFFATDEPAPDNVYVMLSSPTFRWAGRPTKGQRRRKLPVPGLCQNINTETHYCIFGATLVRLIREDEHDQPRFEAGHVAKTLTLESA